MATSFHRGLTVCDCRLSSDGWAWQAFVAVDDVHPAHGSVFLVFGSGIALHHVAHTTGVTAHDEKWWFVVGDDWPNEDKALERLKKASDRLTSMT